MVCILAIYAFNPQIKEDMLNWSSDTRERWGNAERILVGIVKEGDDLEDQRLDGRIIL